MHALGGMKGRHSNLLMVITMHQPDISNAAQQAQERASAMDMKRAALEFDQARPRVGPDGWAEIDEEEEKGSPRQTRGKIADRTVPAVNRKTSLSKSLTPLPEVKSQFSRIKRFLRFLVRRTFF